MFFLQITISGIELQEIFRLRLTRSYARLLMEKKLNESTKYFDISTGESNLPI
jgi:hypothetical protein